MARLIIAHTGKLFSEWNQHWVRKPAFESLLNLAEPLTQNLDRIVNSYGGAMISGITGQNPGSEKAYDARTFYEFDDGTLLFRLDGTVRSENEIGLIAHVDISGARRLWDEQSELASTVVKYLMDSNLNIWADHLKFRPPKPPQKWYADFVNFFCQPNLSLYNPHGRRECTEKHLVSGGHVFVKDKAPYDSIFDLPKE